VDAEVLRAAGGGEGVLLRCRLGGGVEVDDLGFAQVDDLGFAQVDDPRPSPSAAAGRRRGARWRASRGEVATAQAPKAAASRNDQVMAVLVPKVAAAMPPPAAPSAWLPMMSPTAMPMADARVSRCRRIPATALVGIEVAYMAPLTAKARRARAPEASMANSGAAAAAESRTHQDAPRSRRSWEPWVGMTATASSVPTGTMAASRPVALDPNPTAPA
jgi:hypothetical protein